MIYAKKAKFTSGLLCGVLLCFLSVTPAYAVFINELHYDNVGGDVGEKIELSGAAGVDLSGWSLVLYNGSRSLPYSTIDLVGVFDDQQNGMGVLAFDAPRFQNGNASGRGSPDGVALVDDMASAIQFLSYEGSFTAAGMMSTDIGVAETPSTPAGYSLQLTGTGRDYADFIWVASPLENTFGGINQGQHFLAATTGLATPRSSVSVPAPSSLVLLLLGLFVCFAMKKCAFGGRSMALPA